MPTSLPAAAGPAASDLRAAGVEGMFYPCSDGRPMADNTWQAQAIIQAASDLAVALPEPFVAADILVYPERGNPSNCIAPDVLVACGVGRHHRMHYRVWAEGKPPDWVLEVASPGTQAEDRGVKRRRYAEIGVPEYWLFDPKGDVYPRGTPRLQGLRLVDGGYRPLESRLVDGERTIRSEVLGLDVRADGELLRFRDAATGEDVRHRPEVEADEERAQARAKQEAAQRKTAEARAHREAVARSAAEARVAELEAALRRAKAGQPP